MKKFAAGWVGVFVLATASLPAYAQDESPEEGTEEEAPAESEDDQTSTGSDTGGDAPEEPGESDDDDETPDETPDEGAVDEESTEEADESGEAAEKEEDADPVPSAQKAVGDAAETSEKESKEPAEKEKKAEEKGDKEKKQAELPDADPDKPFGDAPKESPDRDFVPLEDIDEGGLETIIPAKVYPRVEWDGTFRARTGAAINWDLDTEGTSAILPPVETFTPEGNPVDPEKDTHWDTNLKFRLDPTLHITEQLRVHTELDLLDNLNFGSLPAHRLAGDTVTPDLSQGVGEGGQLSPRGREFFQNAVQINELYGQVETLLGQLTIGRMDDDWGLGIFANSGDCQDCDYGDHVDRFKFQTKVWKLYGFASLDFPDEGVTSRNPFRNDGQPYDLAQVDDVDQYNFGVFKRPTNREEMELQGKRLLDDQLPVFNGGVFYRFRKQDGRFSPQYDPNGEGFDPTTPGALIYRGERAHIIDLWAQFLYQPDFDTKIRVELEGITALGRVDNATDLEVGLPEEAGDDPVNCFDDDQFSTNEEACTTNSAGDRTDRNIQQFGLGLESEFQLDSPVSFGFNGGMASGGTSPNWGTSNGPDLQFYRFNPDYHVDKIMFRNVIGTVTNAYYFNPWAMVKFLDSSSRHVELQVDAIGSRAFNVQGTPSGSNPWLGLEFDAAVRYVNLELFTAALEGGILFPFEGLAAVPGRPRYQQFGTNPEEFNAELNARIAWTVGAKFFWNF